ncbi:transposable element Tcb2 transposase [Trichonephila clavipes]|nr:transposable element Tcb2 transposase [Trichonephila clavipes]
MEAGWSARPGSGRPRRTSRREDHHIVRNARVQPSASSATIQTQWCGALGKWTAADGKSRFNLSSDDNRVRVRRPRGECPNPAFALQRHTAITAGVIVWGVIAYNTWSPLVLIRGTMTAQWYVHDILQPHVLPIMQRLPGAIFQKDNARPHTLRVSQVCLRTVTILPRPARSLDLSPIEHIWDHLGWRVGYPTTLNELEARLQQIRNEISQNIIQNLNASMSDRIASCKSARGCNRVLNPTFLCLFP